LDVELLIEHRRDDHEDDQEDEADVHQWRDIDLAAKTRLGGWLLHVLYLLARFREVEKHPGSLVGQEG
jgi:hypothetical protein